MMTMIDLPGQRWSVVQFEQVITLFPLFFTGEKPVLPFT